MEIPLFNTYVNPDAYKSVQEVLFTTFLSEGKIVNQFERRLSQDLGIVNPVAVNSGTSALHLALILSGISEGDEVILPAQTFIASGLVILQQKAIPVFADINYNTGNISVESIREKITSKTKAIMPVHWAGYPCDMDEILSIAKENNLVVIEDAAHALGAEYKARPIGAISDFTCFSFQAIKHLTTGDGGAVACLDPLKFNEAITKRWFGIDRNNAKPSILGERSYELLEIGYKYHLNDYSAALGLANLSDFKLRLSQREAIANYYTRELVDINGVSLLDYRQDRKSAYWLFCLHIERREDFIRAMKAKGISTSVVHQGIDKYAVFGGTDVKLENQRKFDSTQIHIPIHDAITMEHANYIVTQIKSGW